MGVEAGFPQVDHRAEPAKLKSNVYKSEPNHKVTTKYVNNSRFNNHLNQQGSTKGRVALHCQVCLLLPALNVLGG